MAYAFLNKMEFDQHIKDVRDLRYPQNWDISDVVEEIYWVKLTGELVAGCSLCDVYYLDAYVDPPQWKPTGEQLLALRPDLGAPTYPTTKLYAAKYSTQRDDPVTNEYWGLYVLLNANDTSLPYSSIPYGTDFPPRFSSISWRDDVDVAISGCTFSKVAQTHTLYIDQAGRLGIVDTLTPVSYNLNLTVHGNLIFNIPSQTGDISGVVGPDACALTGTVTVPLIPMSVSLDGKIVCS